MATQPTTIPKEMAKAELDRLETIHFFGELRLSYENGAITIIHEDRTLKAKDFKTGA